MPDRRHALRLVGSALLAGFAGCSSDRRAVEEQPSTTTVRSHGATTDRETPSSQQTAPDETEATAEETEATDTETDANTPAADVDLTPADLTLSGTVRRASVGGPPRLDLRLTNDAEAALHYVADVPLPMDVIYNEGSDDYSAYLIPDDREAELDPASEYESWDSVVPDSPRDGCWQGPPAIVIGGVGGGGVLDAEASVTETYTVLDAAGDGVCFTAGEYTFQQDATVNVRGRSTTLDCRLRVVLRVTGERTVELAETAVLERDTAGEG